MTYHTCTLLTAVCSRDPRSIGEVMTVDATAYDTTNKYTKCLLSSLNPQKSMTWRNKPWQTGQQVLGRGPAGFEHGVLHRSLSQRTWPSWWEERIISGQMKAIEWEGQTVKRYQTHRTVADITGILYWPPLDSMIVTDTRMDTACKHISQMNMIYRHDVTSS